MNEIKACFDQYKLEIIAYEMDDEKNIIMYLRKKILPEDAFHIVLKIIELLREPAGSYKLQSFIINGDFYVCKIVLKS